MRAMNKWLLVPLAVAVSFAAMAQNGARPGPAQNVGTPANTPFLPNAVITQGFDSVSVTPGTADPPGVGGVCPLNAALTGWFAKNNASPLGTTCVFNGGSGTTFPAQSGAVTSYAAMNFNASTGSNPISTWFVTPRVNFGTGAALTFFFRSANAAAANFPDRIQVRLSTAADAGTPDVGTAVTDVGTFTTLLVDINPTLASAFVTCPVGGFTNPAGGIINGTVDGAWCQVTINNAGGIPTTGSGRIAFRHFVQTSAGPSGANSNFIGIDTFSFDEGAQGTPVAAVGSAQVNFNRQLVGASSLRTATLSNTGTAPLTITALTTPTAPFAQVAGGTCTALPITLAAGASCTIQYSFSPTAEGNFSQLITVTSDGGNPTFTLLGQGVVSIALPSTSTVGLIALITLLSGVALVTLRRRG